jgi:CHASE2 domain-containing sensor protein
VSAETQGFLRRSVRALGRRARSRPAAFYIGLAGLFLVAIAVNHLIAFTGSGVKPGSLDMAVRMRLSSPRPDPSILILDIDESSLARMATDHGRWPWPRSVLAETLAGLSDAGAKAVLVNLTLSDPDKDHPDDDATLQDVLSRAPNVVFPITRLNPANDALSTVAITNFQGAKVLDQGLAARPLAVIAPAFPAARARLGFNNLKVDPDGAVRRYDPWRVEPGFAFPSLALRTLQTAGLAKDIAPDSFADGMILNWRNKHGDYARRSFADAYADLASGDPQRVSLYKDKLVIIGASAPGIAVLKGTAASPLTDDNVILATAMDDLKSGTWLRPLPALATSLLSALAVIGVAASFVLRMSNGWVNSLFAAMQSGFIAVTIYCASYTTWFVDISTTILFVLSYFAVAKIYAQVHLSALRGNPTFSDFVGEHPGEAYVLAGMRTAGVPARRLGRFVQALERRFGVGSVLFVDNLFDTGHMLQQPTRHLAFAIIAPGKADGPQNEAVEAIARTHGIALRCDTPTQSAGEAGVEADERRLFRGMLRLAGDMV